MSKLETVKQLPSTSTGAELLASITSLEKTLAHYDKTLATAVNRLLDQGDAMALELEPVLELRQQLLDTLTTMMRHSKNSCDAARSAAEAAGLAVGGLQEAERSLRQDYARNRPAWWKYGAVSALSVALLLVCVKLLPALAIQPSKVEIDSVVIAQQIAADLRLQCQQRRQPQTQTGL